MSQAIPESVRAERHQTVLAGHHQTVLAELVEAPAQASTSSARTGLGAWQRVCAVGDILPNTGICALVGGRHVAVFHVDGGDQPIERLFAIDNVDPHANASVLSRGLVGSLGNRVVVASPLYKHHFDLRSGECLEMPERSVAAYPVRVEDDAVLVAV
ncbi:nitrite reductase small subunit NirD [Ramlibacter humi]|uniref:Nitrite reductase small subunit NirD n=1 Tax=Ramlibacter humi TaxID=2530451 RepID=A0A4Z0BHJ3_9BURK|nr:nitrite reductase small subunit NirD [Ramlibacter humi]